MGAENYYIYGVDEQDLNTSEHRARIEAAHDAGAKVFCAEYETDAKYSAADVLDLLVAGGAPDPSLAALYHSYGHRIFSYDNLQAGVEAPQTYRRNYGLLLWQNDYDGAMDFAYYWAFNNTWNDFDCLEWDHMYYRDHNFVYPTVSGVIDTVQWEGFREGVDDVRYLSTLLDRVEYSKSLGMNVSSVEAWISDLKETNLSQTDLDGVRGEMAAHILSLPEPTTTTTTTSSTSTSSTTSTSTSTSSSTSSTSSTSSSTTTTLPQCAMPGNDPPCDDVSLAEIIDAINLWAVNAFQLGDVIDLINSWADSIGHPPF